MVLLSVSSGASVGRRRVSSFFESRLFLLVPAYPGSPGTKAVKRLLLLLLLLNHDWFACQLQRAEFVRKGSHEGPLFRMFPLSLQSIISNQMRPRRLRGAWFSHLLRHPARRRSGSILSPGAHTGYALALVLMLYVCSV